MRRGGRGRKAVVIFVAGVGVTVPALIFLLLIGDLVLDGWDYLSGRFFVNFASRFPERAGIRAPLLGTLWLLALTAVLAIPVSVGGAIYLEEFAPKNRVTRLIQANIENLAGVPSIVHGVLGLAIFVHALDLGRSVMAGAMTLATLLMPMIAFSAREAIRNVPAGIREAAFSLGSTRWQVVRHQVVPLALPGILSGLVTAISRAAGEAAPLILIGAVTFIAFTPEAPTDPFTALPVQIFHWATRPEDEFRGLAAATSLVLLLGLLGLSGLAALLRRRLESGGARRETGE